MTLKTGIISKVVIAALGLGGLSTTANADWRDRDYGNDRNRHDDHRDDRRDDHRDWHDRDRDHNSWDLRIGDVFAPPVQTTTATQRVWVEPVYRTVTDRVWVEPVYQTDTTRVWVEPVYQVQDRVFWDHGRRIVRREQVVISAGHFEDRTQQCLVTEGRWQNVERTEVITPGHWQDQVTTVQTVPQQPTFGIGFNFHGR